MRGGVLRELAVLEPEHALSIRADPERAVAPFEQRVDFAEVQPLRFSVRCDRLPASADQPAVVGGEPVIPFVIGVAAENIKPFRRLLTQQLALP